MKNIFRSPWFYVILYAIIDLCTSLFNGIWSKVDYLILQPIPDKYVNEDNDWWLDWYSLIFTFFIPLVLIYFLAKWIINSSR